MKCPDCDGKGYVLGIDTRYPQDGNVALICPTCKGRRAITEARYFGPNNHADWCPMRGQNVTGTSLDNHTGACMDLLLARAYERAAAEGDGSNTPASGAA